MSGDGVQTTKFWQSGTFWSFVVTAIAQVVQQAVTQGGMLHFSAVDSLSPEFTNQALNVTGPATLVSILTGLWRRAVAKGPLSWRF